MREKYGNNTAQSGQCGLETHKHKNPMRDGGQLPIQEKIPQKSITRSMTTLAKA
jgi:ribosomal protein L15